MVVPWVRAVRTVSWVGTYHTVPALLSFRLGGCGGLPTSSPRRNAEAGKRSARQRYTPSLSRRCSTSSCVEARMPGSASDPSLARGRTLLAVSEALGTLCLVSNRSTPVLSDVAHRTRL